MARRQCLPYNVTMFRLAHLSDVHLGPLPDIGYRQLVSKRVLGYVNWQRNRRRFLHDTVIEAIVVDMKANAPDHVAVTGDLVNLALDQEIELARLWLQTLGEPHDVSVVPGNHDAYVPGALDRVCRAWGPWMSGDDARAPVDRRSFPYLRVRGNVALIGATSARATAPFMANGFFRDSQAHRLGAILDATGKRGLFRVVMIHHPPVRNAVPQHKRLFGIDNFQRTFAGMAPSWCCTAIRICRRCTGSTAPRPRCRWSASPLPARRRADASPRRSTTLSTSPASRARGRSGWHGAD